MKVFLSSTAQDLDTYRKVADDTILRLSQQSVAMERFGPLPHTPVEECERLAAESDVVICIVAHRYGYIPEKGRGSITRREVEAAHNAGKDVLVWIVDDDYPWTEKKEQDLIADPSVLAEPSRIVKVTEGVRGLLDFKTWLRTTFTPEKFSTPDDLGRKIAVGLANYVSGHGIVRVAEGSISIARLPVTGSELFGREAELQLLDNAWASSNTNIVSFVAWGGVGKTALVNHWLKRRMSRDNYRGAERVYAWSFFSQGAKEGGGSADLFIDQALRWFGDGDPTAGSPWEKGERLARHIRQARTVLILDGLEPLQYPPGPQEGRLKDAALQALLIDLAAMQPGLCVVSTRERIGDLVEFENSSVVQHDLEHLSPQAGAQILRSFKVGGDQHELEEASREFGGHAFSITLLGSYLEEVLDGDIRRRNEIQNLFEDTRHGKAAERMIAAYEKWLGEGLELAILRLLGLFDRPADRTSIEVLRERPIIVGLTDPFQNFKGREWNKAVGKLRRLKILGALSPDDPALLDAHPLVRDYFKQQLERESSIAWREANNRLYEHLKKVSKEFPDTVEEMSPLFAAMAHGCAAGRYEESLEEVYYIRIQRRGLYFSSRVLGATGLQLAALSNFFEVPWDRLRQELSEMDKGFVLNEVGRGLIAFGRLQEARQAMEAAYEIAIKNSHFENAAISADNLIDLYTVVGDLEGAVNFTQHAIESLERNSLQGELSSVLRATLGHVWHQMGREEDAAAAFRAAEELQKRAEPEHPMLYSVRGFRYSELLLDQGRNEEVKERAEYSLDSLQEYSDLLSTSLDSLLLGRVHLQTLDSTNLESVEQVAGFFQRSVEGLRKAGRLTFLPLPLLSRAKLWRFTRHFEQSERDLSEVYRIATRSGMALHIVDYHLESARLRIAQSYHDQAHQHAFDAKEMINRTGYHRRDKEVQELEAQLA